MPVVFKTPQEIPVFSAKFTKQKQHSSNLTCDSSGALVTNVDSVPVDLGGGLRLYISKNVVG